MKWATRPSPHIDRTACAWLIRRFVDAEAEFIFVDDPGSVPQDATAFDMRGLELGHHRGMCSFEVILERYRLDDPALAAIGRIVHEADIADERYDAPEAPGLDMIVRGLSLIEADDQRMLAHAALLFEGLYAYQRRATSTDRA